MTKEKWANASRVLLAVRRLVQVPGPRHAKLPIASAEITSGDNDLAMVLSSDSKGPDDRIQELAARVMDDARKDPESVIVQDPRFSTGSHRRSQSRHAESARHLLAEMVLGLDETPKIFDSQYTRSYVIAQLLFKLAWRAVVLFVSFRLDIRTAFLLPLGNFQAWIASDLPQHCRTCRFPSARRSSSMRRMRCWRVRVVRRKSRSS